MLKAKSLKSTFAYALRNISEVCVFRKHAFAVIGTLAPNRMQHFLNQCDFYLAGKPCCSVHFANFDRSIMGCRVQGRKSVKILKGFWRWLTAVLFGRLLLVNDSRLARVAQSVARGKCFLVDSTRTYRLSAWRWAALRGSEPAEVHRRRFASIRPSSKRVIVLGTGPSASLIFEPKYKNIPIITCNSAIKSRRLTEMNLFALCVTDPLYYLSPTKYCTAFLTDLQRWILLNSKNYIVVPAQHREILLRVDEYLPPERILGVLVNHHLRPSLDFKKVPVTADSNSVLTALMLPLAATYYNEIIMIGFDGHKPGVDYFWHHNDEFQYTGLIDSIKEHDVAFFKNQDGRLYENHSETVSHELRNLLASIKVKGCTLSMEHPSYLAPLDELYHNCV